MTATVRRYCNECASETLHDKFTDHIQGEQLSTPARAFWGICTLGISELGAERYLICQQCQCQTPLNPS